MMPLSSALEDDFSPYSNLKQKQENGWAYAVREKNLCPLRAGKWGPFVQQQLQASLTAWRAFWRLQHGVEFDFCLSADRLRIMTRWETGETLKNAEKGSAASRLELWEQIFAHFRAMQNAGLVHGNLKSTNIFIGSHHIFFFDGGYAAAWHGAPHVQPLRAHCPLSTGDALSLARIMQEDFQDFATSAWQPRWEQFLEENSLSSSALAPPCTLSWHVPFDPMGIPLRFWDKLGSYMLAWSEKSGVGLRTDPLGDCSFLLPSLSQGQPREMNASSTTALLSCVQEALTRCFTDSPIKKIEIFHATFLDSASAALLNQSLSHVAVWEKHASMPLNLQGFFCHFDAEEQLILAALALCGAEITSDHLDFFLASEEELEGIIVSLSLIKGRPVRFSAFLQQERWLTRLIDKSLFYQVITERRDPLSGLLMTYEWAHPELMVALSLLIPQAHPSRFVFLRHLGEWFVECWQPQTASLASFLIPAYYFRVGGALDKAQEVLQEAQFHAKDEWSLACLQKQMGILRAQRR